MAGARNGVNDAFDLVLEHDDLAELDAASRRLALRALLIEHGRADALDEVAAFIDGYGALDGLMNDPSVTDILVNDHDEIWVERDGVLTRTNVRFASRDDLDATIERLMSKGGGRVDGARPLSDVALPDGSRMHVVLPPLTSGAPKVSIRRFSAIRLRLSDLRDRGMFDDDTRSELADIVRARRTVAISGGTGCGKITLCNALLAEVGPSERLVTIEETPELKPMCAHWVSLIARPPNVEGKGEVTLGDLFRASLRMRPDRIVVGEVRGPEAVVALDALSTGHPGSLVTVHARSAGAVKERLVSLGAATGRDETTLRSRFEDAFDVIVHIEKRDGERKIAEIVGS